MELNKKHIEKKLHTGHLHARKIPKIVEVKERGGHLLEGAIIWGIYSM